MPKKLCDYLSRITGGNTVIHICDKDKTIRFCNKLEDIRFADIVDSLGYDVIEEQEYFDPVENRNIIFVVIENFVFEKTKYYIPSNKTVKETLQDIIDDYQKNKRVDWCVVYLCDKYDEGIFTSCEIFVDKDGTTKVRHGDNSDEEWEHFLNNKSLSWIKDGRDFKLVMDVE